MSNLPVLAIVGRPNVGKSTLFNRLTRSRDALVANFSGLTRDRQYGEGQLGDYAYLVIDTGGVGEQVEVLVDLTAQQTELAIDEADIVIFVVDARDGLTSVDQQIAQQLHQRGKPVYVAINKVDGIDSDTVSAEFYQLGFKHYQALAATHGRGVSALMAMIQQGLPTPDPDEEAIASEINGISFAIVGRPNVGKSTLVNRILGEERMIACDSPGTTRDSIAIQFERQGEPYTIIDTAGVRRRGRVKETIEKFSIIKTLQAVENAQIVILLLNAREGITDQDLHLLGFIIDAGKGIVIALNQWDGIEADAKTRIRQELERRLVFIDYARIHFISALHGTGVGNLFKSIDEAAAAAHIQLSTPALNQILEQLVAAHSPPLVRGRRIKLRYAHAGGSNPPRIVIHGNQTESLSANYQRYLIKGFRKSLGIIGTPIALELKTTTNPYAGRRNKLTPRQEMKRKRLMRHVKKK